MWNNKYHAKKTVIDGATFASKLEAERYTYLRLYERANVITDLKVQRKIPLYGKRGNKICNYFADFTYRIDGNLVIEDVKGQKKLIPPFPTKRKLLQDNYKIDIMIIRKKDIKKLQYYDDKTLKQMEKLL